MAGNATDGGRSVVSKVVGILLTFMTGSEFSLSDIARLTGLPISTVHRLVAELLNAGFLVRAGKSRYRTGTALRRIGAGAPIQSASLHERARRVLEDLALACPGEAVRLGVIDGREVAVMEKTDPIHPVSITFEPATVPLHATAMGKVLLAFSQPKTVETIAAQSLPPCTPYTITCPDRLQRTLATVRLTRLAISRQEWMLGRFDVAVPVFGPGGTVAAALEVGLRRPDDFGVVRPALSMAGRTLSHELQDTPVPCAPAAGGAPRHLELMLLSAFLAGQLDWFGGQSRQP
jgi:DNA-binding IclR family transcriptional regulator